MSSGKGLPKEQDVNAVLAWPCWQKNGEFSHSLFRSLSSMFNGRGLPKEQDINAVLTWPCWQKNGEFSHSLFRSLSSMFNGRGLPKEQDVNAILSWPVWQVGDLFSFKLFRSFSSIFNGTGLPEEKEVQAIVSWPCWQLNGEFQQDLFCSFSSMFNGKGLPKAQDVEALLSWPAWQVAGEFSYELFRSFSSMFHGRGQPIEADVKAILAWPCWQTGGQFNHELFRSFSNMFSGKGLPCEKDVQAILSWPLWLVNGEFSHSIFADVCALFSGKGLPKEAEVAACMQWLSDADGVHRDTLALMRRLFSGAFAGHGALGLPPVECLQGYEQRLIRLFDGTVAEEDHCSLEIKQIVLFLANKGGSNYLSWPECERFFTVYPGQLHGHDCEAVPSLTAQALSRLHTVLLAHGGQGIRAFFAVNDKQDWARSASERDQQLVLLSLPVPLDLICGAFDRAPPESWRDYIYFGHNRATPPNSDQWHEICDWRRILPKEMSDSGSQRHFIDSVTTLPQSCKKRLMAREALEAVITLFPAVHLVTRLSHYSPAALAELFCAALNYVQKAEYGAATLTTLLPALLQSGLTLPNTAPKPFPLHAFINSEPCAGGITIHCPADVADGEQLLHAFVATVTTIVRDMFTAIEGDHLTVERRDGERLRFAVPKCVAGPHHLTIRNWSPEDFKLFFDVTETSECCLAKPFGQDDKEPYGSNCQQRMAAAATTMDDSCESGV